MRHILVLLTIISILSSCMSNEKDALPIQMDEKPIKVYSHDLGDIPHDPALDSDSFRLCDPGRTMQGRSRLRYPGGREELEKVCLAQFQEDPDFESFTGYVTVRFMMNCKHETGRFRSLSVGLDFSPIDCPAELKDHLIHITRGLDEWKKSDRHGEQAEYSKYINFKIENGRIQHVLV